MERKRSKLTVTFVLLLLLATLATRAIAQDQPKVIDLDALAARGETLANQDPLTAELRNQQPDESGRRGLYIGLAAAEGQTAPGPGKQRLGASLPPAQQRGYNTAVSFSLERNRNAKFAAIGAAIARADEKVAAARAAEADVFYRLGFDIATGIFGDPALGAQGNTATGPGSLGIRDALSPAGQRGFNAAVKFYLGQAPPPSSTPERRPRVDQNAIAGEAISVDRYGKSKAYESVWKAGPEPPATEIRCRGARGLLLFTNEGAKLGATGEAITTLLLTTEPGPYAAGPRGEGLRPGECAWVDRPVEVKNVRERYFLIRFETPANAQLKQTLHGSQVDRSPSAAERFPDAHTIPAYLDNPNHYWRFYGVRKVDNYYVANGYQFFKPPISDHDRVLIPK